ncbi:NAD(P)/FAD-dependent oxidoreductase [Bowmanella yangjiangensis]|nr:FAD-binding oxidoreductase [Bowmanella yangjiangensis]
MTRPAQPMDGLTDSLWFCTLGEHIAPRPSLHTQIDADVVILGAGYSGLWTAWFLKHYQPDLQVVMLDAAVAGAGASGRNGGWLIGGFGGDVDYLSMLDGEARRRAKTIITGIVAEAGSLIADMQVHCDFYHGGNLYAAARYPQQYQRMQQEYQHFQSVGFDEYDLRLLSATDARQALNLPNIQAALYSPHCARVHPLKLARGLARAVERCGVTLYEQSPVMQVTKGLVKTHSGSVKAPIVVSALEAYQRLLGLDSRATLTVQSLLIATEPLQKQQWEHIGLNSQQTFADASRLITYGQRTADDRLVFGARGGYRFGGKVRTSFAFTPRTLASPPVGDEFDLRAHLLGEFFPQLATLQVSHGWGGSLALSRRFRPHALFDPDRGMALLGGYGGEGVGASMLFGKTMAALIAKPEDELVTMPWAYIGKASAWLRRWESEPWPYLSYQCSKYLFEYEDKLLTKSASDWQKRWVMRLADGLEHLMS